MREGEPRFEQLNIEEENLKEQEKSVHEELENIDSADKNTKKKGGISRRKFLGKAIGATGALMAGSVLGGEIPLGEAGVDYMKEQTKDLSHETGEKEKPPGFGLFEKEALIFQYLIMPQNKEELKQLKAFLEFVHGREYRTQVAQQLTMYKKDPEVFDKKGWEFYKKYFKNRKIAKIEPRSVEVSDLAEQYALFKKVGAEGAIKYQIEDIQSRWDGEKITVDVSDLRFKEMPPSVTIRHEADHVTQDSKRVDFGYVTEKSSVKEVVSIFDGVEMVLIDKALRQENGLSKDSSYDKKPLYSEPIKFPSGATYHIRDLAGFAEKFFNMQKDESFDKTFVQLLADPVAISFFNNLVYNNPGRSHETIKKLQRAELERKKKLQEFDVNKKAILKNYIARNIKKFEDKLKENPDLASAQEIEEWKKQMDFDLENNPDKLHRRLVRVLEITDDPKYAFGKYKLGHRKDSLKIEFSREKDETDILRDVIGKDVVDFWEDKNLIFDLGPEKI